MSIEEIIEQTIRKVLEEEINQALESMSITNNTRPVMSVKELAEYINMSEGYIRQEKMNIPHFYLGTRLLFNKEDIDKWRLSKSNRNGMRKRL
ncbi:hypothetical protein [Acetoanaerobium noterae]|uniref:hypothetical protein n=1 Tax=Acetoanaerobium noterae TaxID=745369 RepID=UPI00332AB321